MPEVIVPDRESEGLCGSQQGSDRSSGMNARSSDFARMSWQPLAEWDCASSSISSGARRLRRLARSSRSSPRWDVSCRSGDRSEEHTSELQSLMRISYAVFGLKKNTTAPPHHTTLYKIT